MIAGPHGMQELIDHLSTLLKRLGVRIHLNTRVDIKNLSGPVVIATSAPSAANLLQDSQPSISGLLRKNQDVLFDERDIIF